MKIVVGLGNPGEDYAATRHNLGFRVIDEAARLYSIKVLQRRAKSLVGVGQVEGEDVVLAKPQTYMNNSGRAVFALLKAYSCALEDMLIVCDDFHLELARLRMRRGGSSGGQKGLQSIIDTLGSGEFARLRIGIGVPKRDPVKYVLRRFKRNEEPRIKEAVADAARACGMWVVQGVDACMTAFN